MKIFAASLEQETNTFSPLLTGRTNFIEITPDTIAAGEHRLKDWEPFATWQNMASAGRHHYSLGMIATAQPAGRVIRKVYENLRDELLMRLEEAGEIDVILLLLHGAMAAQGYDDCEGDLINRVRQQVGPDIIIAIELDLHCHLTDAMLMGADIIITYKEYPHIDISERGVELFDLAVATKHGHIRPAMATFDCKMMGMYPTTGPVLRQFLDRVMDIERKKNDVLSISFIHGFPWGDSPDAGGKILVVTDNNPALADSLAKELGLQLFSLRQSICFQSLSMDKALSLALQISDKSNNPVVVADQSDNPGGGAPGDATFALRWLLDHGVADAGLAIFYDPEVVKRAMIVGVGACLPVRLGGKLGATSGEPIDLFVEVIGIRKNYKHRWPQQSGEPLTMPIGNVVALRCRNITQYSNTKAHHNEIDLIVSSEPCQCFSPCIFNDLGIDPKQKRLLIPKSTQHFYSAFADLAAKTIYMAGPGAVVPLVKQIPYKNMPMHNKYPWVENPHQSLDEARFITD